MLPQLPIVGLKRGLFEKAHRKRMGPALWLYGWLHTVADRRTGRLPVEKGILEREQRQVLGLTHSRFADHWARLVEGQYLSQDGEGWKIARFSSIPVFFDGLSEIGQDADQEDVRNRTNATDGCPKTDNETTGLSENGQIPQALSEIGHANRNNSRSVVDVVGFSDLELREQQQQTYRALVQLGVMDTVARELSTTRDPGEVLAWVDYASRAEDLRNPPGLVVRALRDGVPPPVREEPGPSRYISGELAGFIEH